MKTKYFFISLVFAAFLSSSIPAGNHSLEIGKEAPALSLSNKSKSLADAEGKYVIVNFWSADDPDSRMANMKLSKFADSLPQSKVKFIGICTDADSSLSNEIMKADGIPFSAISLDASDITSQTAEDFQIATGNRSFLIDPFGNLVSVSPSEEEIKTIVA
ncbi:MAG: peroxiredoxin family protein [Muribaculaceae bacterium]|nr:peroxiredoxin family protein [Muribaculaceae bacterium]MDE6754595.1 peroxiredoxin family protein [Muribaculaceae bacterium]